MQKVSWLFGVQWSEIPSWGLNLGKSLWQPGLLLSWTQQLLLCLSWGSAPPSGSHSADPPLGGFLKAYRCCRGWWMQLKKDQVPTSRAHRLEESRTAGSISSCPNWKETHAQERDRKLNDSVKKRHLSRTLRICTVVNQGIGVEIDGRQDIQVSCSVDTGGRGSIRKAGKSLIYQTPDAMHRDFWSVF